MTIRTMNIEEGIHKVALVAFEKNVSAMLFGKRSDLR